MSRARNAGESAICPGPEQPSAEIVRVERAKRRRECDLSRSGATLCGDRACRGRSRVSRARNAGESASWFCPAQPSAEIARVEGAKRRRECDLPAARATLYGDRACRRREMQARVRFVPVAGNPLRRSRGRETQARVPVGFVRRNPLRRSCVSRVRNAGESASCKVVSGTTLCGDRACRVRFGPEHPHSASGRYDIETGKSLARANSGLSGFLFATVENRTQPVVGTVHAGGRRGQIHARALSLLWWHQSERGDFVRLARRRLRAFRTGSRAVAAAKKTSVA